MDRRTVGRSEEKQQRILEFVRGFLDEHGRPPTVRDIVRGVELSSTSVADYNLRLLQRRGLLQRIPGVSRGIELPQRRRPARVPLMGTIAAGSPLPTPGSDAWHSPPLDYIEVPSELLPARGEVYALRVKGTSMVDALVDDGDIVLLRPTATASDGEMVACWLTEEKAVTLKRLFREGEQVRLQPANPAMAPLRLPASQVEVQGKVVAVLRRLE